MHYFHDSPLSKAREEMGEVPSSLFKFQYWLDYVKVRLWVCSINILYHRVAKEHPWAVHFTSSPNRAVGTLLSVSTFGW